MSESKRQIINKSQIKRGKLQLVNKGGFSFWNNPSVKGYKATEETVYTFVSIIVYYNNLHSKVIFIAKMSKVNTLFYTIECTFKTTPKLDINILWMNMHVS